MLFVKIAPAQFDTGQIAGFIKDESDAVLPGAAVTATNEATGDQRRTVANPTGYYVMPNLPVGTYSVSAEAPGFKKSIQTGIVLDSAAKLNVDLSLTVGAITESIEVRASAVRCRRSSAGRPRRRYASRSRTSRSTAATRSTSRF